MRTADENPSERELEQLVAAAMGRSSRCWVPRHQIEEIGFDPWGSGDPPAHESDEEEQNDRAGGS